MRSFPQLWPMDLRSDSKTQVSLTPTTSPVSATFTIRAPKAAIGDKYLKACFLNGRLRFGFDQAASGGAVVVWDELPRVIEGLAINSELLGSLMNTAVGAGPILKHVVEYFGNAYRYAGDHARAQIPSTDGDTAVDLYFQVPFTPLWAHRPTDFAIWIGLLHNTEIIFSLNTTTCLDSISTGAVIEATCNLQMWIDYLVSDEFNIPVINHWHLYQETAGSGTEIPLQNFGGPHGLQGVQTYSRIAAIVELMDQKGLGGPDGADNITAVEIDQLGLKRVTNVDAFVKSFKQLTGGKAIHAGNGTTILHDGAANPEGMAATPNAALNSATLMYLSLFAPCRDQKLTKLPKWNQGDLQIVHGFASAPSSGSHRVLGNEIKEFTAAKKIEIMQRAGLDPSTQKLAIKKKLSDKNNGAPAPGKLKGLPEKITRVA